MSNLEGVVALIIDDNVSDATLLRNLLTPFGVKCEIISGVQALEKIHIKPHLVFLDLEMPLLNGYEVLEKLRSSNNLQNIPVVAYTSHLAEMSAARHAGFHSFLGKPLRSSQLADQVTRILNDEHVWEIR